MLSQLNYCNVTTVVYNILFNTVYRPTRKDIESVPVLKTLHGTYILLASRIPYSSPMLFSDYLSVF